MNNKHNYATNRRAKDMVRENIVSMIGGRK